MPDFIDRLGVELAQAVSADTLPLEAERPSWRRRWPRPQRLRLLLIAPAFAALGAAAALAGGILGSGAPVAPKGRPVPTANNGAAIRSLATLLPVRVADPAGGLPWGLRTVLTTRGDVCLQVGRLAYGTIGALGEDGALGDDHRFHPFSENYLNPFPCVPVDAHGHGFTTMTEWSLPTSAIATAPSRACLTAKRLNSCPGRGARDVYFGLLGPEATGINYVSGDGRTVSVPTVGSDGAYLIVTQARPFQEHVGSAEGSMALLQTGVIRAVTYKDGRTCRPTAVYPCAPVGLVLAQTPRLTQAALASPIRVREVPASAYCTRGVLIRPCDGRVPSGFTRQPSTPRSLLVEITYTARAAVTSSSRFYYVSLFFRHSPTCPEIAFSSETTTDIHAGQRLTDSELVPAGCHGVIGGLVRYYPDTSTRSAAPEPDPTDPGSITVGRFSFRIP